MARIRSLKPDFFEDEDLAELPFWVRILFEGLWCHADKAGRLEDRPLKLKAKIFPYDKVDIEKGLVLLAEPKQHSPQHLPFIVRYEADGERYIQILTWEKHENPHHTEKESEIPPFNGSLTVKEPLLKGATQVDPFPISDQGTMNLSKISFQGLQWTGIGESDRADWAQAYPACDIDAELRKMAEWIKANPKKGKKSNYRKFIVGWLSRTQDGGGTKGAGSRTVGPDPKVGKYIKPTPAEQDLEARLRNQYEAETRKFMTAKGYKAEDDIPFNEFESFSMFKSRRLREAREGGGA